MKEVKAGVIGDLKGIVDKFAKILDSGFDMLKNWGADVEELEELPNGSLSRKFKTAAGNTVQVIWKPIDEDISELDIDDNTLVNLEIKTNKGNKKYNRVKLKDITKLRDEAMKELLGEVVDVKSSRKMSVTLQRISSSKCDNINLTAISANYSASDVLADLNAIVSDDTFVEQIQDEPVSFSIEDDGDSFDIQPIEEFSTESCYTDILKYAIELWTDVVALKWNIEGEFVDNLTQLLNDIEWTINGDINTLAEWCYEEVGRVPHPLNLLRQGGGCNTEVSSSEDGYKIIQTKLRCYLDALELYYCNFSHDKQRILDEMIRRSHRYADYTIDKHLSKPKIYPC